MIRTAIELRKQAVDKQIRFWPVHECSFCGYQCGYFISNNGERVQYDCGCDCSFGRNLEERSWDDLAYSYNLNQPENNPDISPNFIQELNDTWQFEPVTHSPTKGEKEAK